MEENYRGFIVSVFPRPKTEFYDYSLKIPNNKGFILVGRGNKSKEHTMEIAKNFILDEVEQIKSAVEVSNLSTGDDFLKSMYPRGTSWTGD